MVTALIKINGTQGSNDGLSTGVTANLSNSNDTGVLTWLWEFLSVPPGSSTTMITPTSSTASFVPDTIGSYLIKLTVTGAVDSDTDIVVGAVLTTNLSIRIPATREENAFDSVHGWSSAYYNAMIAIDTSAGSTHAIGSSTHTASTLAQLNTKVSDATLDDSSDSRTPTAHDLSGALHNNTTLANLNAKISDATLDDSSDSRTPSGSASGDLTGTYPSPSVYKIRGQTVSANAPNPNDALIFTAGEWLPTAIPLASNTLDQAYDQGGSGVGRTITADSGAVVINASGGGALELDGYLHLNEISDPTNYANTGMVYAKDDDGDTELFYMDDSGNVIQITKDGDVNTSLTANTLDQAYDEGGSGVGRTITADSGSVKINVVADNAGVEIDSSSVSPYSSGMVYLTGASSGVKAIQVVSGHVVLEDGYLALEHLSGDPSEIIDTGVLYTKDDYGCPELFYIDEYGRTTQITKDGSINIPEDFNGDRLFIDWTPSYYAPSISPSEVSLPEHLTAHLAGIDGYLESHVLNTSNPHETTMDLVYDAGGYGSGRTIVADSGPIYINAGGNDALELDGYLIFGETVDPTELGDSGILYVKDDYGDKELYYMDNYGNITQITKDGTLNSDEINAHTIGGGEHLVDTLANFNTKISDATLFDIVLLDSYLALDGSDIMSGNLNMGNNSITNVANVDGYDLPTQFQSIANDDAYQQEQLTSINSNLIIHVDNTSNPHLTNIGNLGNGTLSELNSIITDATLFDISKLDSYLALDGSNSMTSDLDVGGNNITNVVNVDGYNLPNQFQSIANDDAYQQEQLTGINSDVITHTSDTSNPHSTDIGNLGSGTLVELNSIVSDATLFDISLLDSYLSLNGEDTMSGNLDMGSNNITNVGTIDGYNLSDTFQSIENDDAYQQGQLTEINNDLISHISNTSNPHSTDIGNLGSGTLIELNSIVSDATLFDISLLDSYLALNGEDTMSGDLNMGSNNITNVGTVDGYDLPTIFQSIENDDAYQQEQLTEINNDLISHTSNTSNPHLTDIGNLGSGTLSELNLIITDATLFDISELDGYLALDGSNSMTSDLDVGGNNITNVVNVDGYNLPNQFQSIANDDAYQQEQLTNINSDVISHTSNTSNPHLTDIGNLGSGTISELNSIISDATLFDISFLDSYLALNGEDTMSGNLDMGNNNIINVGTVDGYDLPTTFQSIENDDAYQQGQLTLINGSLSSHTSNTSNPHETTMDLVYDAGGSGLGRTIVADSGAIYINASGGDALELDGYLILGETSDPTALGNAGIAYTKDIDGYSELHVIDNFGNITQITSRGFLYTLFPEYAISQLPSATPAGQMVYVSDESGGAVMAFSDGTNWRRTTDRNIVS